MRAIVFLLGLLLVGGLAAQAQSLPWPLRPTAQPARPTWAVAQAAPSVLAKPEPKPSVSYLTTPKFTGPVYEYKPGFCWELKHYFGRHVKVGLLVQNIGFTSGR